MSQINFLQCPICNPEAADLNGIRRTVVPTSSELAEFIKHVVEEHTQAGEALKTAQVAELAADAAAATANEVAQIVRTSQTVQAEGEDSAIG
ncbi:MAG: hypothetical protein C5B59_08805 [Bacteroidetes bacterium]|nr:MAG: hypothetical protein C5B59_08805 [Bacteroidota bacterium]